MLQLKPLERQCRIASVRPMKVSSAESLEGFRKRRTLKSTNKNENEHQWSRPKLIAPFLLKNRTSNFLRDLLQITQRFQFYLGILSISVGFQWKSNIFFRTAKSKNRSTQTNGTQKGVHILECQKWKHSNSAYDTIMWRMRTALASDRSSIEIHWITRRPNERCQYRIRRTLE